MLHSHEHSLKIQTEYQNFDFKQTAVLLFQFWHFMELSGHFISTIIKTHSNYILTDARRSEASVCRPAA
jgi:hypothetical protein